MPVHNGQAFLDQAIGSIRGQTHRDFELIVVDDGPTDLTPDILRRHAAEDGRVRVFTQTHTGLALALNRGLKLSSGSLIARMDADDVAMPPLAVADHPDDARPSGSRVARNADPNQPGWARDVTSLRQTGRRLPELRRSAGASSPHPRGG